ncbi:MAG TPA: efflux transporter outer membrane subunit [Opitutaceae bacterium]|jgi:multidrug efflux system outer membrane protein|nr:efflux transporter outer membrane subunit [Opitutaceae bacterium]
MSRRLLLLPALFLGGCAVGPSYHRPDPGAPAVTRGQAAPESASLADLGWWDLYHDPALDTLVRASLTGGFDARIAAARVQQARALALEARGQLFPGIGYAGNADRGRNTILGNPSPAGTGTTGNGFDGYLAATWEFDLWGRVRRLDEAARDQYLATGQAQRGVWLSLVTETASDYFDLRELDEELAVTRDASNAFGESLRLFDQRLRGGIASRLETASAQAAQAAEAAQVPLVERAIAVQENALSVLLGRNPGPIDRGAALSAPAAPPQIPAGLPSDLLERRPDVKAAEYAAMATNAQIGATIGGFLPRIGLSAIFGGVSPRLQDLTSRKAEVWNVGASVTGPLFQAGTLHGEYLQAKAAWELAKLQYEQTALGAFADVADALVTREKLEQSRLEQEREVAAYQEAVKVATERYKAGEAGYFELLQAQEQLYPAEITLARTRRDELVSVIDLYKALGGGWNLKDAAAWSGSR